MNNTSHNNIVLSEDGVPGATISNKKNEVSTESEDANGIQDAATEHITNITPWKNDTKNEIINFADAVTDVTGITIKTNVTKYNPRSSWYSKFCL